MFVHDRVDLPECLPDLGPIMRHSPNLLCSNVHTWIHRGALLSRSLIGRLLSATLCYLVLRLGQYTICVVHLWRVEWCDAVSIAKHLPLRKLV